MNTSKILSAVVASALFLSPVAANAHGHAFHFFKFHHFHPVHHMKPMKAPSKPGPHIGGGGGISPLPAYFMGVAGCGAIGLMIAAAMKKTELTRREAHYIVGDCFIPFIGGELLTRGMTP